MTNINVPARHVCLTVKQVFAITLKKQYKYYFELTLCTSQLLFMRRAPHSNYQGYTVL